MFQQLDLTNFRQHESLLILFEQGVVALRGNNEAGKSSVLEAIAYAMFGASALRESLEDVVTWGRKAGELKVKLDFNLNGVDYRVIRGKSGAEVKTAEKILATGQKEVTRYIETLLGASSEVCAKLMLANQDDIKGALSKGPAAAIELIEALSNLGVIDKVISIVQAQLACGTTVSVESRIQTLVAALGPDLVDETAPLVRALEAAAVAGVHVGLVHRTAKEHYDAIQADATAAQQTQDTHQLLLESDARATAVQVRAEAALADFQMPACFNDEYVKELRKKADDVGYMKRAIAAAELLGGWESMDIALDGTAAECTAARDHARLQIQDHTARAAQARTKIATFIAQKITQTACGLCGKDLTAIPEVVTKNAELDLQISNWQDIEAEEVRESEDWKGELEYYESRLQMDNRNRRLAAQVTEFCKLDETVVPCGVEWTGPEELTAVEGDPHVALKQAEAAVLAYHSAVGRQQQIEAAVGEANEALLDVQQQLALAEAALANADRVLIDAADRLQALNAADSTLRGAQEGTNSARQALEAAQAVHRERVAARKRLEDDLKAARKELAEMEDNNALIRFLREARPLITDQLWGIVLSTVSSYFSDIRGTPSIVTRADNGFKVDGHNVAGLSGSTKDALGLAIRKALTRTFLPNASFMMLDEPGGAMDSEREANMLGLIASGGFEQVLLITHSDVCESFATQVIQL